MLRQNFANFSVFFMDYQKNVLWKIIIETELVGSKQLFYFL